MTLLFVKPHSGDRSGLVTRDKKGGCRNDPVPSTSDAGRFVSWRIQLREKLRVFQQAVLQYSEYSKMC